MEQISVKRHVLPQYTIGEEIFNAVSHGVGALFGIAGCTLLLLRAIRFSGALGITAAAIYGGTLILLYTMSTLYHALTGRRSKYVFRVFDHCTIFLLISGTYTPMLLVLLGDLRGQILCLLLWVLTALCVTLNAIDLERYRVFSMVCYIGMGWCAVAVILPIARALGVLGFSLLLLGGISYTAGLLFFRSKKRYMHAIWHLFVLAGSILQYFCILFFVY